MNVLLTKERPKSEVQQLKSHARIHEALKAAAAGEPNVVMPADNRDGDTLRVLIVDDHRANADTLSLLAARWGHNVRRAYDGVTGLALAAAFRPDVLLLDMLMPDVSGFDMVGQVRRQDRLKHCFIIAITGRTDAAHRCKCYEAGVDLFLIKPVAPAQMRTLLDLESEHVRRTNSSVTTGTCCSEFAATY